VGDAVKVFLLTLSALFVDPLAGSCCDGMGAGKKWIVLAALRAMAAVAVSVLVCHGLANQLARVIGTTGMIVIVRLSSFLLVCIGVQDVERAQYRARYAGYVDAPR
jgi:hypothetical protein